MRVRRVESKALEKWFLSFSDSVAKIGRRWSW